MNLKSNWEYKAIGLLAALGVGLTAYLTYVDTGGSKSAFCVAGGGCDIVRESIYARLFGIHLSIVGLAGYIAILVMSLLPIKSLLKPLGIFLMSITGFSFSMHLVYVQLFVLHAICPWCMSSASLMSIIFVVGVILMIRSFRIPFKKNVTIATLLALALGLLVLAGAAACSKKQLDPNSYEVKLAKYLTEKGAVMYGAYWCPHCTNQKKSFGDAFEYVKYVECDPKGQNANPALCQARGVKGYPTWEIGGKMYEGEFPLSQLAGLVGYTGN